MVSIPLATLQVRRCYEFDLFLRTDEGFSLYRAKHVRFTEEDRRRLIENGVQSLHIQPSERAGYRTYLIDQMESAVADDSMPIQQRCMHAARCARALANALFEDATSVETLGDASRMVRSAVTLVMREPDAMMGLASMLRHDYYTTTHLINVSTLSLILAYRIGITDAEELHRIGLGGLLHDIGKARIDPAVLNCKAKLTDAQMDELRRHPDYGMMIMMQMDAPNVSRQVLRMVHQHHERLDGSGYPVGLVGDEINRCAQICAVVDIYDAMTCQRPYRDALPAEVAIDHLRSQSGPRLNSEIVETWIEIAPALGDAQLTYEQQQSQAPQTCR